MIRGLEVGGLIPFPSYLWLSVAISCYLWLFLVYLLLSLTISDWLSRIFGAFFDYIWISSTLSGYPGLSLPISGYQVLSFAIMCYHVLSHEILCYFMVSQAILGYLGTYLTVSGYIPPFWTISNSVYFGLSLSISVYLCLSQYIPVPFRPIWTYLVPFGIIRNGTIQHICVPFCTIC